MLVKFHQYEKKQRKNSRVFSGTMYMYRLDMPVRNKIKAFLESRGLSAYRFIKDTGISDKTGYELASDPSKVPTKKVLNRICSAYQVQPGELLEWVQSDD